MALKVVGFEAFLNDKPTLDELCKHVRIDAKWYKFGVLLKLDTTKLEGIRVMNEDSGFKTVKMFELWLNSNPIATRREIMETLKIEAIGEITIAEEYNKALKESESYFCHLLRLLSYYLYTQFMTSPIKYLRNILRVFPIFFFQWM